MSELVTITHIEYRAIKDALSHAEARAAKLEEVIRKGLDIYQGHGTYDRALAEIWYQIARAALKEGK